MKFRCAPGDEALVRAVLDGALPSETVKENAQRIVRRVATPGAPALYLKLFRERGVGARLRRLVADRAAREYAVLDHLKRAGVPAAEPVACGTHDGSSFLITREVPLSKTLKEHLLDPVHPVRRKFMGLLGRYVRRIHDAGVRHDDLHAGNILATSTTGLFLVDVQSAAIRPSLTQADRVRDLGFLILSLHTLVSAADVRRLVNAYWDGKPPAPALRELQRAFLTARENYAADRTRRCLISGREFEKAGSIMLRRPLTAKTAKRLVDTDSLREIKNVGRRRLWLVAPDRFVRQGPRAKRIWRNAHALAVRHVSTPRLWAWAGDRILGEWLADAAPLNEFVAGRAWTPPERRAFRDALARFVRKMHREGVHHGDLKANNILVTSANGGFEFFVIDLDRAEFYAEVPLELRLSDLAQLNAAVGAPATVGDRLAFYRIYAGRKADWNREWKERVREIMRRTRARKHRWPAGPA